MSNVIKIDKSVDIPYSVSRGQIMRFDFWAKEDECPYNDNAVIYFSYAKTKKTIISVFRLGTGLIKREEGRFYAEFDTAIVRDIHDVVYGEFFPYGTSYRSMTFILGLNDSAYGGDGDFYTGDVFSNGLGHAVFNNSNVDEENPIVCNANEFTQLPLFYDPNNGLFEAAPNGFEKWIDNTTGKFVAQNNYDKWLMRLDTSISQIVADTVVYFNVNIGTDETPIRILGTKGIKIELSSNANEIEDLFIDFTQYTLDTYKANGGKFELFAESQVSVSKISLIAERTFDGSGI